jgi:hypothetical protein
MSQLKHRPGSIRQSAPTIRVHLCSFVVSHSVPICHPARDFHASKTSLPSPVPPALRSQNPHCTAVFESVPRTEIFLSSQHSRHPVSHLNRSVRSVRNSWCPAEQGHLLAAALAASKSTLVSIHVHSWFLRIPSPADWQFCISPSQVVAITPFNPFYPHRKTPRYSQHSAPCPSSPSRPSANPFSPTKIRLPSSYT